MILGSTFSKQEDPRIHVVLMLERSKDWIARQVPCNILIFLVVTQYIRAPVSPSQMQKPRPHL